MPRAPFALLACVLGAAAGGCSMSFPLTSMMSGSKDEKAAATAASKPEAGDVTGSLSLQPTGREPSGMSGADWTLAQAALNDVLARSEEGASRAWENPTTRARGTVTPVATAFMQDGFQCRNFLISLVKNDQETWYDGTACRTHRAQWSVQSTRLRKS